MKISNEVPKVFFSKADIYPKPEEVGIDLADEEYREYIQRICRDKGYGRVQSLTRLSRSTLHTLFVVRTSKYERVFKFQLFPKKHHDEGIVIEEQIFGILRKLHLPTVKVYVTDTARKLVPVDYQVSERVQGKTLHDYSHTSAIPLAYLEKFGERVAEVHRIPATRYGTLDSTKSKGEKLAGKFGSWQEFLSTNLSEHCETCVEYGVLSQDDMVKVIAAFTHIDDNQHVLLHGDVANHNVFTFRRGVGQLIDWEDALAGDPAYDLAFYATGCINNPAWFESFIRGYERSSQVTQTEDYTRRFWLYYLRISIAKAVVHIRWNNSPAFKQSDKKRIHIALKELRRLK